MEPPGNDDPLVAAAAALTLAVNDVHRVIVATRGKDAGSALLVSEAKCESLAATIKSIEDVMKMQQRDLDAVRATLSVKKRAIEVWQKNYTALRAHHSGVQAMIAEERAVLAKDREGVALERVALAEEREVLRSDRALLDEEKAALVADKCAAIANLKHMVGTMQAEMAKQERAIPASTSARAQAVPPQPQPSISFLFLSVRPAHLSLR
jgi:hypothetical protein